MTRIFIVGLVSGGPHFAVGKWLKSYDATYVNPEHGYDGGKLEVTENEQEAEQFEDIAAAFAKWNTVAPEPYHIRADGKPNKPLTAFSISVKPDAP
jgi:hypothetical protein